MAIITNGIKFGNLSIDNKYCMTKSEMLSLGSADDFPAVFPIWCTDEESLYILYKTEEGNTNIVDFENITNTTEKVILYPIIDKDTSEISWEIRNLTDDVPEPVILKGIAGDSAYQVWLNQGNTGTIDDFLKSFIPDLSNLNSNQIYNLKEQLGINELHEKIDILNAKLDVILN